MRDGGQEAGLDLGGIVHAGWHAVRQQVQQEGIFAGRRGLDQLDQLGHLLGIQRQRRDAERGAFGGMLAVGLKHLHYSWQRGRVGRMVAHEAFGTMTLSPLK